MIDVSDRSALAICDHCGRRELLSDHATARAWLATHEAHSHPSYGLARDALYQATRRASEMALDRRESPVT